MFLEEANRILFLIRDRKQKMKRMKRRRKKERKKEMKKGKGEQKEEKGGEQELGFHSPQCSASFS